MINVGKINILEEKIIDESLINYTINESNGEFNIFFDKETFNLIGWQNSDMYQNSNITLISSIHKNTILSKDMYK